MESFIQVDCNPYGINKNIFLELKAKNCVSFHIHGTKHGYVTNIVFIVNHKTARMELAEKNIYFMDESMEFGRKEFQFEWT